MGFELRPEAVSPPGDCYSIPAKQSRILAKAYFCLKACQDNPYVRLLQTLETSTDMMKDDQ